MSSIELFWLLVTQLWQVTLLFTAVWIVTRLFTGDRPHLAHGLWVLVLLKCLTPPIWSSPTSGFSWMGADRPAVVQSNAVDVADSESDGSRSSTLSRVPDWMANHTPPVPEERVGAIHVAPETDLRPVIGSRAIGSSVIDDPVSAAGIGWPSVLLLLWGAGAAIGMAVMSVRFFRFLAWMRRCDRVDSPELERFVQPLARRLGIKRSVRLLVLDSPVGPAVLGLFRPTIILPASVVEGKSKKELEPLLAHELIHIRRGDLLWALVQTLAKSLFWFHPLVWIADRMVTRESERSCDEETIGSLGCAPAIYARSLLEVLEQKNRLQVAPALPGVRPVDITSARLERVMRLGNGIHDRTPVGVWLVMLLLGAFVLPGAALVFGQDSGDGESTRIEAAKQRPVDSDPGETLPAAYYLNYGQPASPNDVPSTFNARSEKRTQARIETGVDFDKWEKRTYDVADLLAVIQKADLKDISPESRLILELPQRRPNPETGGANSNPDKTNRGEASATGTEQPTMGIIDGVLHVYDKVAVLNWTETVLDGLRKRGFKQIVIETRFSRVSIDQLNAIGINWEIAQPKKVSLVVAESESDSEEILKASRIGAAAGEERRLPSGELHTETGPDRLSMFRSTSFVESSLPVLHSLFSKEQKEIYLKMVRGDQRSNVTSAPTITMFNGRSGTVTDGVNRPFVVGMGRVRKPDGTVSDPAQFQPVIELFREGTTCCFTSMIQDDDSIAVDFKATFSEITDVKNILLPNTGGDRVSRQLQAPKVSVRQIKAAAVVPDGGTIAICSFDNAGADNSVCITMLTCRAFTPQRPVLMCNVGSTHDGELLFCVEVVGSDGQPIGHLSPARSVFELTPREKPVPIAEPKREKQKMIIKSKTKSDGSDDYGPLKEALGEIGLDLTAEGKFEYEITNDCIVIRGDGIEVDGGYYFEFSADSAKMEFVLNGPKSQSYKLHLQGNVKFLVEDSNWTGDDLVFEMSDEGMLLEIRGDAEIQCMGRAMAADEIRILASGSDDTCVLEGNARVTGTNREGSEVDLSAKRIEWNLDTDTFNAFGVGSVTVDKKDLEKK